MREVVIADKAGFCFGVGAALEKCQLELKKGRLYCIGAIIHNMSGCEKLEKKGLITVSSIKDVPFGARLIIRAHGEPDSTYQIAKEKNIEIIDATCPFVTKIHKLAQSSETEGKRLLVIGDRNHPEVKGILGSCKNSLGAGETPEELQSLISGFDLGNICVVAQTTLTRDRFNKAVASLKGAEIHDTICKATKERQDAAAALARISDAMVVIGDSESSNSRKLFEICKKECEKCFFVENSKQIPLQELGKYNKIGIAAGASSPSDIILEVFSSMSEIKMDMNSEMMAYMSDIDRGVKLPQRGEVVTGHVVQVKEGYVVVNLGCKKDGMLPAEEVSLEEGETLKSVFAEGDEIQAKVIKTDDGEGNILLSKKKLQSGQNWDEISAAVDNRDVLNVTVVREVNGGVIASYKEVSGFIPMSQLADHFVESAAEYIGKTLPVIVTRVDQRKNKAVFSHKSYLMDEKNKKIAAIWDTLSIGDVVEGRVMRFTEYGAFVDIGGIDGLLHISEISWGKLKHPQEVLEIGQTVNVKILSMNAEKGKISLGLKQNAPEPWSIIDEQYHIGDVIRGKVVQIKEYGAFIEIAPGLDGLVHISEIAYKRVNKVGDELAIGQEVEAKILEIDKERKRISLSIKETLEKPAEVVTEEAAKEAAPKEAE